MGLPVETVERVRAFWRAWEAQTVLTDRVSVVTIGDERFTCAPQRLRGRLDVDAPTDLASLIEILGSDVDDVVGKALLTYADAATLRPVATDARRRGLASKVGSAAANHALALGLVAQWRSRIGNDASARVADQLGFVELGTQMTVCVR